MAPLRLLLALAAAMAATTAQAADPARYMPAELIAESLVPVSGSTILVGLRMRPRTGWHGYWSNPGDAGFAPTIQWSAPEGVDFGPLLHPAPKLISAAGISSYVHEGEHILLSRMTVPRGFSPGTPIPVSARASWAACTATMCVPLNATFTLDLVVGSGVRGPDSAALASAMRKLPRSASGGSYWDDGKSVRLILPASARLDLRRTRFFPDDNDAFKTASGRVEAEEAWLVVSGIADRVSAGSITGVATDGRTAYRLTLIRSEAKPEPNLKRPAQAEAAAPKSAIAPTTEEIATKATPAAERAPAPRLWAGLLLAAALAAAIFVAVRRRRAG
jgi:DsbC/DsbD-like thiol-disulfide interchange protein